MKLYTLKEILEEFEPVIGLEVHVELSTENKMFCACSADWFGKDPNTNTCPVCLGMPGALPVANKTALEYTVKIAKGLNCKIHTYQQFDRKHYFYPDLPKGYQITQFYHPVGTEGKVIVEGPDGFKEIRIRRIHLEEDTGKLIHKGEDSLVDFNRSGVPLVEIVTEPDFRSATEVKNYLKLLQVLVRWLGVSDADMEKGSMRLEPNISLRKKGETGYPSYKVEVKNINSFNFVVKAIEFEILRQGRLLMQGETPAQETRGFDVSTGKTVAQRRKEVAQDYRYLPEPDIPPINFTQEQIDALTIGTTPFEEYKRLLDMGIEHKPLWFLLENQEAYRLFKELEDKETAKKKYDKEFSKVLASKFEYTPRNLAVFLMNRFEKYKFKTAQQVLEAIAKEYTVDTLSEDEIKQFVSEVISENPQAVQDYKAGKQSALQFLVGKFMQKVRRRIDVKPVIEEFRRQLAR